MTAIEITFLYRCRRCSKIEKNPRMGVSKEDSLEATIELSNAVHGKTRGAMSPRLLNIHSCSENACGISDLIGYEPANEIT